MFVLFFLVVVLQCFDCIQANTTFAFGSVSSSRPYLECVRVAHLLFIFFGFSFFSMSPFIEINRDPQKRPLFVQLVAAIEFLQLQTIMQCHCFQCGKFRVSLASKLGSSIKV